MCGETIPKHVTNRRPSVHPTLSDGVCLEGKLSISFGLLSIYWPGPQEGSSVHIEGPFGSLVVPLISRVVHLLVVDHKKARVRTLCPLVAGSLSIQCGLLSIYWSGAKKGSSVHFLSPNGGKVVHLIGLVVHLC